MRTNKTALFIEWNCQRTVARSDLQNGIFVGILFNNKIN